VFRPAGLTASGVDNDALHTLHIWRRGMNPRARTH
jgi:hypothetical protein